jgi:hypothetical protein
MVFRHSLAVSPDNLIVVLFNAKQCEKPVKTLKTPQRRSRSQPSNFLWN